MRFIPKESKKVYRTNKNNVYHIDETWSLEILKLKVMVLKVRKFIGGFLVVIDNFSKFGLRAPTKNKNAQTITTSFAYILISPKRKPFLIQIDRTEQRFVNKMFTSLLNIIHNKRYFGKVSLGAVFAENFNHTLRDLLKSHVFEKWDANWIDVQHKKTNPSSYSKPSSAKLTPIQATSKEKQGYVYQILLDQRKKIKPKFQIGNLVSTTDIKRTF